MTDWADGIEARNYGIKSEIDASMFSELMRSIIPLAMIAGALLFYSWVRSEIVNLGYENQSLFAREESLLRAQKRLALEEETLCNPERIDRIARSELGMTTLRPNQFLSQQHDAQRNLSNTLALAESESAGIRIASTAPAPVPAN